MAVTPDDVPILDVSRPLANDDGTPSEYFEELWFTLIAQVTLLQETVVDLQAQIDLHHP